MKIQEIDTPALLVDLDAMEHNLACMAGFFADKPAKLRPHFKNHRVISLARRQLEAGAIGMTVSTLREAEILVEHGITEILLANEIAGDLKIRHALEISAYSGLILAVDNASVVRDMGRLSRDRGVGLRVLVDVNLGLDRCGVSNPEAAADLARLAAAEGLQVHGVMGYEGHLQVLKPGPEKNERCRDATGLLLACAEAIRDQGIRAPIVSTGGTGTYYLAGNTPGVTEIQAGTYLVSDTAYVEYGALFRRSLTMLATVVSATDGSAVLDCGLKVISAERGLPCLKGIDGVRLKVLHAVHGLVDCSCSPGCLTVGKHVELWVYYSDGTINLHQKMYGVRGENVEEVFTIER
jgi:D-serine deaminase-like pyridoxal phosphate-dependent protein